jgi:hypothetical protein
MSLVTTKLNVAYSLDSSPGEFVFTDVEDYSSQSVALADITGVIKVTAPSGVVYTGGSPDIDGSVSRINTTTILIPLLADGSPEVGNYSFEYTATDNVDTVVYTVGFNYQYVSPTAILTPTVDCLSPELTGTDATNYLSGSTTPSNQFSLIGVDTIGNTFTVTGEKSGLVPVGDTFNIINSTANDGNYTVTSVVFDGTNTLIGVASVTDATVDGVLSTKTNTIYYPPSLALAPVVGYNSVVSTNTFYSQTQSFKVITKSFYDFGNGISVIDTISDTSELDVDCDVRLCEVFCCIDSTLKSYLAYRGVNDTLANLELQKYILATSHLSALRQAFECGYDTEVNTIVQEIMTVTQCTPDCTCSDDSPQPITGLGAANITVVQSSGNGIEVTSNTVGNTTTYTLSLSQSVLNSITAATATSSVISSDGSVTITSVTAAGNTEYDLSVNLPAAVTPVEFMSLNLEMDYDVYTNTRTFTVIDQVNQAVSNLKTPTSAVISGLNSYDQVIVKVDDFQTTPNTTFKMDVDCYYQAFSPPNGVIYNSTLPNFTGLFITPTMTQKTSGSFEFAFRDFVNATVVRQMFNFYSKLYFTIKIYE